MKAETILPTERQVQRAIAARMRDKHTIDPETGCWPWHGSRDAKGYGQIRIERRLRYASHIALELVGMPRTTEKPCALHRCDNPACVNPAHLWWGTMKDNTQDMMAKGRQNQSGLEIGHELSRARKIPLPVVNCKNCGVSFVTSKAQYQKNHRHFCSRTCCWTWQRANFTGARRLTFGELA